MPASDTCAVAMSQPSMSVERFTVRRCMAWRKASATSSPLLAVTGVASNRSGFVAVAALKMVAAGSVIASAFG